MEIGREIRSLLVRYGSKRQDDDLLVAICALADHLDRIERRLDGGVLAEHATADGGWHLGGGGGFWDEHLGGGGGYWGGDEALGPPR